MKTWQSLDTVDDALQSRTIKYWNGQSTEDGWQMQRVEKRRRFINSIDEGLYLV